MTSGETSSSALPPGGTDRRRATVILISLIVAFIAASVVTRSPSQTTVPASEMKLKNFWRYASERFERQMGSEKYFECNYTSQTCQRGYRVQGFFLFELLADDRKTVISHQFCVLDRGSRVLCLDFDTGVAKSEWPGERFNPTVTEDMPDSCNEPSCAQQWIGAHFQSLAIQLYGLVELGGRR